jgi:argininosuccinate synthase
MKKPVKKVVLAYSGGLDTSIIIPWIKENYGGAEIIAYCGDVGQGDDLEAVKRKALATGASKCVVEDLREEFLRDYAFKALSAGAVYEDSYLLGTSLARPLLAYRQVKVALAEKADALAHGATGKGNDQVRFEVTYGAFAPQLTVIAPWREWNIRSREDALDYAAKHNVPVEQTRKDIFSRDGNLWHLSHEGGNLEDTWDPPRKEMFKLTVDPLDAPAEPQIITLAFERGMPVAVDGERLAPVPLVEKLNRLAGAHGVGRVDLVENRLVGMKSRGVYETPGGTILQAAHRGIESITLDRGAAHLKDEIMPRYAELIYNGFWFAPERLMLQALIDQSQEHVEGTVRLKLYKGLGRVVGRKSPKSLYSLAHVTFEEDQVYDQRDAEGFIKLNALRLRLAKALRK